LHKAAALGDPNVMILLGHLYGEPTKRVRFAAILVCAIGDQRLAGTHLRVPAAIVFHDE